MAPVGRRSLVPLDLARLPGWDGHPALTRQHLRRLRPLAGERVGRETFTVAATSVVMR